MTHILCVDDTHFATLLARATHLCRKHRFITCHIFLRVYHRVFITPRAPPYNTPPSPIHSLPSTLTIPLRAFLPLSPLCHLLPAHLAWNLDIPVLTYLPPVFMTSAVQSVAGQGDIAGRDGQVEQGRSAAICQLSPPQRYLARRARAPARTRARHFGAPGARLSNAACLSWTDLCYSASAPLAPPLWAWAGAPLCLPEGRGSAATNAVSRGNASCCLPCLPFSACLSAAAPALLAPPRLAPACHGFLPQPLAGTCSPLWLHNHFCLMHSRLLGHLSFSIASTVMPRILIFCTRA